jgi:hypothetical protein
MTLKYKLGKIIVYYLVHIRPTVRHALRLNVTIITKKVYKTKEAESH